jgi:hypothetical protein
MCSHGSHAHTAQAATTNLFKATSDSNVESPSTSQALNALGGAMNMHGRLVVRYRRNDPWTMLLLVISYCE